MRYQYRTRRTFNTPGHAHELTFSCYHKHQFLKADRTCGWLVEAIDRARTEHDFAVWAYVFMPDHVHMIVWPRTDTYDIAVILRAMKQPVARRAIQFLTREAPEWLPRITQHRGQRTERHFWQPGGGCDRNIDEPNALMGMLEYIHLNPVRKGLVSQARDWRWSSAAWFETGAVGPLQLDRIPPEWCL